MNMHQQGNRGSTDYDKEYKYGKIKEKTLQFVAQAYSIVREIYSDGVFIERPMEGPESKEQGVNGRQKNLAES